MFAILWSFPVFFWRIFSNICILLFVHFITCYATFQDYVKVKVKVNFISEQAIKSQMEKRSIVLPFL